MTTGLHCLDFLLFLTPGDNNKITIYRIVLFLGKIFSFPLFLILFLKEVG